jgi:hypothetical protein
MGWQCSRGRVSWYNAIHRYVLKWIHSIRSAPDQTPLADQRILNFAGDIVPPRTVPSANCARLFERYALRVVAKLGHSFFTHGWHQRFTGHGTDKVSRKYAGIPSWAEGKN